MFEFIRTHQRLMQFILLCLIVPPFVFAGISGYFRGAKEDTVATVAGEEISQREFDDALRDRMNQMRQRLGERFDEALFNTPEARQGVLDNLISQRALGAEIRNAHLTVADAELQKTILMIPGLTLPDGSFDKQGYARALAAQGLTQPMFESNMRQDMAQRQLVDAVQGSAFASKTQAAQVDALTSQERNVDSIAFKDADFDSQVKLTDALLKDYYEKNGKQFELPEVAKIEYVVLNGEAIADQVKVSDDEINEYYKTNVKNYTTEEQRRASHILIKVDKKASAADKAAAKAKAEDILAQVKKQPANFAALAKQYSQDEGSAAQGGDLDYFSRGMMVKAFEDAAFDLKQDQISDLVESDFGFHIIRLTGIKPGSVKPLDEVRSQIMAEIRKKKADKQFSELAETFTNTVYEQPDSLKPVADKLKLTIQSADQLSRTASPAAAGNPVLSNPKFLKALFADDVIKNKHNMEALDLGGNTLVSAHIVDYRPASKRPFEEVKALVSARVTAEQADKLARQAGEARLAALQSKPGDADGFKEPITVSRMQPGVIPHEAFTAIMKADARTLPAFVGVDLPGLGYSIYRITKVQQGGPNPERSANVATQLQSVTGSQSLFTFVNQLKQNAKVKINKPVTAVPAAS